MVLRSQLVSLETPLRGGVSYEIAVSDGDRVYRFFDRVGARALCVDLSGYMTEAGSASNVPGLSIEIDRVLVSVGFAERDMRFRVDAPTDSISFRAPGLDCWAEIGGYGAEDSEPRLSLEFEADRAVISIIEDCALSGDADPRYVTLTLSSPLVERLVWTPKELFAAGAKGVAT